MEEKEVRQNRHIEISVVRVEEHTVTFRISRQTHREINFTPNGDEFKSSCGVILNSQSFPECGGSCDVLFVRGCDPCKDDEEITVPLFNFAKIMQAVNEYNETDGKGYEKPWPQRGDKYFFISSTGVIHDVKYDNISLDNCLREFGNFFRTREEAEAAGERVRKALKGDD